MIRKILIVIGLGLGLSVPVAFVANPASGATNDAIAQALVGATLQNLGLDELSADLSQELVGQLADAIDAGVIDPAISAQVASLLENPAMLSGLADVFEDHRDQESNSWSQSPFSEEVVEDDGTVGDDGSEGEPGTPDGGIGNVPARTGAPVENTEDSVDSGDADAPESSDDAGSGGGNGGRGDGGRGDGGRGDGGRGDGGRGDGGRGDGGRGDGGRGDGGRGDGGRGDGGRGDGGRGDNGRGNVSDDD